ncbi:MAG: peptidase Ste24p [Rariglobus sp.]|jgi:predicted Zn-dependent protease|nr:peptidase Ste24p [Rariglobus sp.]
MSPFHVITRRLGGLLLVCTLLASGGPLHAQFSLDKLQKGLDTAKNVGKVAKGVTGIGLEEERIIGGSVALEIIGAYGGVLRDEAITARVNLIGRALARYSDRPDLDWRFGVLASEQINAFSAPAGYVFITRGLYATAANDDELAAILAHEIAHITERHALKIVSRGELLTGASGLAVANSSDVAQVEAQLKQVDLGVGKITRTLFEKGFDPATEYEADRIGRQLAITAGYAPGGLRSVLQDLSATSTPGSRVFSSHPPLPNRIKRLPNDPAPVKK